MDDATLFEKLLRAEDEVDADAILERAGYGLEVEGAWRPLGDMPNNRSVVTNQQTEATAAFVEKIVNGIDALLMAECFTKGIDPRGSKAPGSMTAAVEQFFGVRDGQLANLVSVQQTELAEKLQIVAVGKKLTPCYLVIDSGEGQTPEQFPNTFLSLVRENKMGIPFVQGKFNCGGTGVLPFCGEHKMQLVVSRRHPDAPVAAGDTSRDLWGFTIVRRMKPSPTRPNSMYVYLAPQGRIPRFAADSVNVLPENRGKVPARPYARGLAYGTCVKLYNFRWRAKSLATTDARYELERYLHSPCLPFRITETRDYNANYFSTTLAGVWATIGTAPAEAADDDVEDVVNGEDDEVDDDNGGDTEKESSKKVEPGFPSYGEINLAGIGQLPYRVVVFRQIKKRHIPIGVFFTVNGQVHGDLPADFISRLGFEHIKDHLLVSVDCTAMDPGVREDTIMASRDRLRKNDAYHQIVKHLKEVLQDHPGLKQVNAARKKRKIEKAVTSEDETSRLFGELLKADPTLANLFGLGDRLPTKAGPGPEVPFKGKKFPTYFKLTKDPAGGLVKHCPVNLTCRVEFETDAVNDYFKRPDSAGILMIDPPNIIEHQSLWNGRFNLQLRVPWNVKPGEKVPVKVSVTDVRLQKPFVSKLTIHADPEADPRRPGTRPNPVPRPGPKPGPNTAPTLALPEVHLKSFGEHRTSLQVLHAAEGDGKYEYWLNTDNAFLTAELGRAKDDADRMLVNFYFKYGLVLCALGMLKEHRDQQAKSNGNGGGNGHGGKGDGADEVRETDDVDEAKRVSFYCDGLARVIVPLIKLIHRGPELLGA